MRRRCLVALAASVPGGVLMLAGCGGPVSTSVSAAPTSSASRATTGSSPGSAPHATASPSSTPTTARARPARWRLPVASARQATVPLGGGRVLVAGGLLAGDVSTGRVTSVDLATGRARPMPSLAVPVHDVAGGLAGHRPLVLGGGNATEQDVVQALHGRSWQVIGHLPTTRSDLSTVADGHDVLAIGGYDGVGTPRALLRVSSDGSVQGHGQLRQGVRYAATAVAGHTAYVFGGEVQGRELDLVQAVDLRTRRTRVVAHLPVPLGHAMAATEGSRILLMGGRVTPDRETRAMWWFDPRTGHFTHAGLLPGPLSDAATATWRGGVWLLGGEGPAVTDRVVFVKVR